MSYKDMLIKSIADAPAGFSPYQYFSDFVEIAAMVIANNTRGKRDEIYHHREERYKSIIQKYKDSDIFVQLFRQLTMAAEESMEDILGEVYMAAGCGKKYRTVFYPVSYKQSNSRYDAGR